jgi:hypothetical protein
MGVVLIHIVSILCDSRRGFELDIGFIDHLQVLATNNYNTIQITGAHAKSFQSRSVF